MQTLNLFKRGAAVFGTLLAMSAAAYAADPATFPAPTGDPAYVPAGARLELIFDGGCALTEGVAAGHDGMIYFSDITFTNGKELPTNVGFGRGADSNLLYLTSGKSLYKIRVGTKGYQLP